MSKYKYSGLFVFFSLITLAFTVHTVQQPKSLQSRAANTPPLGTVILPINFPVLVLEYFPQDPNNPTLLDGVETGWGTDATINGRTVAWWEGRTDEMVQAMLPFASDASRYHGYKEASTPAFFRFTVADTKKYYIPIPRGVQLGTYQGIPNYRPNYGQILRDLNICNYVDTQGVKEVWMYGYHNDRTVIPDESRMSSRYGDVSNSIPKEESLPSQYRMPICNHSFVLYNFTYQPGGATAIANPVHNRIHQLENVIPEDRPNTNVPGSIFWGDFSEYIQSYTQRGNYNSSCGNGHYTPNWTNLSDSYMYNSITRRQFNCETWHPDDTKTTYITAGCERWGCTDIGFYKWWMQNIPGFNNGIVMNGQPMKNWWEVMYDLNAFIENGRSLYGSSLFNVIEPTPDPRTSPTPIPDTILPVVNISNPPANSRVSGITRITTTASDNIGIVSHKILIDNFKPNSGTLLLKECGTVTACTYDLNIDTMELLPDERPDYFVIVVEARDAAGNLGRKWIEVQAVRTPTPTPVPGDITGDNHVTLADLSIVLSNFGKPGTLSQGDVNDSGTINLQDLSIILSNFGK